MKRATVSRFFRSLLFLTGTMFLFVVGNDRTKAQDIQVGFCFELPFMDDGCDVEAVVAIAGSTDNVEIDTYATEQIVSLELLGFVDALVDGGLFEDDVLIDENEGFDEDCGCAEVDLSDGVTLGSVYTMVGDSYLDTGDGDPEFVGELAVQVLAAAPEITGISPVGDQTGSSGQLTVNGFALFDQFPPFGVLIGSIPGVHFGSTFTGLPDGTQIVLSYTIDSNAKSGPQQFLLATRFGQSNPVTFTIYDPPPVVTQVNPNEWQAGQDVSITVTGQHFGICPKISVSGPGVTNTTTAAGGTDTQVQGTVTIDPSSPGGQATVTVTSNGETCNGFNGRPGTGPTASNTAQIDPIKPPPPQILYYGANVGSPQAIEVGQKADLTFNVPNSQLAPTSQTWTVSGVAIASFSGSPDGGEKPTSLAATLTTAEVTFYWLATTGSPSVTLTYCVNNSSTQCSDPVTANFTVSAPTGVTITSTPGQVIAMPDPNGVAMILQPTPQSNTGHGMQLVASSTLPAGDTNSQYQWVQVLTNDTNNYLDQSGLGQGLCSSFQSLADKADLDQTYPYGKGKNTVFTTNGVTNDTAIDDPKNVFKVSDGDLEWRRVFQAKMLLEWIPQNPNPSVCTDSTCSIPVPLAFVVWGYSGCSLNTGVVTGNATTWAMQCSNVPQPVAATTITPSAGNYGYATWDAITRTGCHNF